MRQFIADLFSENNSVSMMRLMSLVSLLMGCAIAVYGLSKSPVDYSGISLLVSVFITAAFGGKIAQKMQETRVVPPIVPAVPTAPVSRSIKVDNPDA
jgi:hypothetical protein